MVEALINWSEAAEALEALEPEQAAATLIEVERVMQQTEMQNRMFEDMKVISSESLQKCFTV